MTLLEILIYALTAAPAAAALVMVILLAIDFTKEELELRRSNKRMDAFNHSNSL